MYYSVTFTNAQGEQKNTWHDWRLIPTTPPMITPPEPYTNYVEIPGRVLGPIDLAEALTGAPSYGNSEGEWQFILDDENWGRMNIFHTIRQFLHGQKLKVMLEEDPFHYYQGRFAIEAPQTGRTATSFTIRYTIEPVRYAMDGTPDGI